MFFGIVLFELSHKSALAHGIATAHAAEAVVDIRDVFTVLENSPEQLAVAAEVAGDLFGAEKVDTGETPKMGSEDFADMLRRVPGAYVWLSGERSAPLHNPAYRFDEGLLPLGAALLAGIAERRAVAG